MANVLPKNALKAVRRFYVNRIVLVGSLVAIVCAVAALFLVVPPYLALLAADELEEELSPDSALKLGSERQDIARAQAVVRELTLIASTTASMAELLDEVIEARPPGVVADRISIERGSQGTIQVGGPAASREALSAYRSALAENPRYKSVILPLGVLTQSDGGNYTITISGTF